MKHPNRREFTGVLTVLDVASRKSPHGAGGIFVTMSRECAAANLPTLIGMGVNFGPSRHNVTAKCGVITEAVIVDDSIMVAGYLYAKDFPEVIERLEAAGDDYGMSYEAHDCRVEGLGHRGWLLTKCWFTGAAILLKNKAAYSGTSICLIPKPE